MYCSNQSARVHSKMKSPLVLALLVGIAAAAIPAWDDDWKDYKTTFNKVYRTAAEESTRRQLWENTRAAILDHNQEAAAGRQTYTMDLNAFSDWNAGERAKLAGTRLLGTGACRAKQADTLENERLSRQALPASVDLRSDSCIPPVKDQGQCGSCWAFAANTPFEYKLCKKNLRSYNLSEQQLVDCSKAYGNAGCRGGWYTSAWQYVKAAPGQTTSSVYPYTAKVGRCSYRTSSAVGTIVNFTQVERNATTIQQAVATQGPVSVAYQVINSFYSYGSGVYSDPTCPNDVRTVNHGVVLVGYGTSASGIDYWIVRNSWGATWGQSGYFFIQRGVNMCNIESHAAYVTV